MSKAALFKEARKAFDKDDFAKASELCQKVLQIDSNHYNALVLLGLLQQKLGKFDDSEKYYREAVSKNKDAAQAWQGLANLYDVTKKVDQYIEAVKTLSAIFKEADQRPRCQAAVNGMLDFVRKHGNSNQLKKALHFILPESPIFDFIEGVVPRPAAVYQELSKMTEKEEEERINKEIAARRYRLGAKQGQVSLEVQREVYLKSQLEELYRHVIDWAEDEETRRLYDEKLLNHGYKKLVAFPPEHKKSMREKVEEWAKGLVILKHPYETAWRIVLEWNDIEEMGSFDVNILREYIAFFPKSGLAHALKAFLNSTLSPFPPSEDDEPIEKIEAEEGALEDPLTTLFMEGLEKASQSPLCHRLVSSYLLLTSEYEMAVDIARKGLELLRKESIKSGLKLQKNVDAMSVILATALIHYQSPKHHPESKTIFEDVLTRNPTYSTALVGLGLILEEQGDYEGALSLLEKALQRDRENIRIRSEVAWCKILMEVYEEGLAELDDCLKSIDGVDALSRDLKAQILWRIGTGIWNSDVENRKDRKGAYSFFISALQQNQNFAPAYTSLGIFFQDVTGDIARANKCFQKAFELSAGEVEAAERLARSFADSKEWELVEIVARRVAQADKKRSVPGKGVSWPQTAIGVVELNNQNYPLAIQAFQAALRISPNDFNAWVGLGEAYTNSGRYIAALKVFTQARKLDKEDWFAEYMLANVHKDLGDYEEARAGYGNVLKIRGNEFGVLIALCETLVAAAFHSISKGYSKDATEHAAEVFEVALKVAQDRPDAFNLWKAVGDACLAFSWAKLNADDFPLETVKKLLGLSIERKELDIMSEVDDVTGSTLDRLDEIEKTSRPVYAAILTFKRGIYASADDRHAHAVAWFNLGLAEHRAYVSEPQRDTRYRQAAIHCFKRAIKLEPGNYDFWNALGVVTSEVSARVAQHALVRSLYINDKNAYAWVNLGALYLAQKDYDLAREAFSRAQSVDPDYPHAWVGQGLSILLRDPEHNLTREVMELFEHAFKISDNFTVVVHRQFANSSFDQLLKSQHEAAFTSLLEPLFSLEKLHQKLGNDTLLLRLSSLFSERARAFSEATSKLETVCEIVEKTYEETEADADLVKYAEAKADLARMYLGQRQYEDAVESANLALDLSGELEGVKKCRLSAHLTAGLAYYYLGQMSESLEMFKTALVESGENPDVIVLLSQVLWAKAGEAERDVAREQLFACIEGAPDHLPTILTMATIGILDNNPDMIEAVVDDLRAVQGDELPHTTRARVDKLLAAVSLTQENELPYAATQSAIFLQPYNQRNWKELSDIADNGHAAEIALEVALNSSDTDPKGLSEALAGVGKISSDLKAIFVAPWIEDGWRGLRADVQSAGAAA